MAAQARFGCDANELRNQADVSFFVDVDAAAPSRVVLMEPTRTELRKRALDACTEEAILIFETMRADDRRGALAALKSYVQNLGPPRDGQTLSMAG